MIVVLIIGILLGIAVPKFIKARESSHALSCVANLKQIDSGKEQYAMDQKLSGSAAIAMSNLVGAANYIKSTPACPSAGTYTVNALGVNPTCSVSATSPNNPHILPYQQR